MDSLPVRMQHKGIDKRYNFELKRSIVRSVHSSFEKFYTTASHTRCTQKAKQQCAFSFP
jgi:hypothetical protein